MSITGRTRKLLWARSGNRCAICRLELAPIESELNREFIIGEECHIVSRRPLGPRFVANYSSDHDAYENLVLLCANDHTRIDSLPDVYSTELVVRLKSDHEKWVRTTLEKDAFAFSNDELQILSLRRVNSGKTLLNIVEGAHAFQYDHPELNDSDEIEALAAFFQLLKDFSDIGLEVSDRVKIGAELTADINRFESTDLLLFGGERSVKVQVGTQSMNLDIATVIAVRPDNPGIVGDFLIVGTPRHARFTV